MICYQDKTFCSFWKDCKDGNICDRAFIDTIRERAKKWSEQYTPDELLVCFFMDKPECFKEKI